MVVPCDFFADGAAFWGHLRHIVLPVRGTSWVCTFTPDASVSSADTVVVPATSAARPADKAAPRADDTGYRTFL